MRGGYGTYNKKPLNIHELHELPRFGGQLRSKMDNKRRGREVGRDLSPNAAYHQLAANKERPRKLVILPAKPPPRKPRSVMKHEHQTLPVEKTERRHSVHRKQADRGIMDELKRVEELNRALVGGDITAEYNLKYAKNMSHQAQNLVEGKPRSQYATAMAEYDRTCFMNKNLGKRKPIFKNYIHNNTSILRKEIQIKKKQQLQAL